jgi:hypothetical protein
MNQGAAYKHGFGGGNGNRKLQGVFDTLAGIPLPRRHEITDRLVNDLNWCLRAIGCRVTTKECPVPALLLFRKAKKPTHHRAIEMRYYDAAINGSRHCGWYSSFPAVTVVLEAENVLDAPTSFRGR